MKKIIQFALLLIVVNATAQIMHPVKWKSAVEKVSDTQYNLIYKASIKKHWHLYSQHLPEGGALPTEFIYADDQLGKTFTLVDKYASESESITHFDKVFEMDMTYFDGTATFVQRVEVKDPQLKEIIGEVSYQTCNDSSCLFESEKLKFDLTTAQQVSADNNTYVALQKLKTKKEDLHLDLSKTSDATQIFTPVKWTVKIKKLKNNEYDLFYKANIEKGWHIYSQEKVEDGPVPTTLTFLNKGDGYSLIGNVREGKGHTAYEKVFKKEIKSFEKKAIFRQKIKINKDAAVIKTALEYMVCNDGQCLPPETENFNFEYKKGNLIQIKNNEEDTETKLTADTPKKKEKKGLLVLFFGSFIAGLAALLTPCVFPMIPMTVSFFTKQSKSKSEGIRNAIIYGLAIVFIYVVIGLGVSAIFGAERLNELSTNPWFNIIFFVLLVFFATSFLGAFEIMLPNSWANKVDSQADRGGMVGIFFMALALAIVSFSCTGPIVGSALVAAASTGEYIAPILSMLGFSMAIALPFALFAAFPGWLNSMPKSGGWLNTVKVVLGFLELALAFKFLSNADLVLDAHWLERETFLAIWIAVFGALAFYLFGKIQLPHDSPLTHISVGRLLLGLLTLTFVVYLIPGLWGAPLKLISGFPPPMNYSESPYGVGNSKGGGGGVAHADLPEDAHLGPQNIISFHDYDKGLAYAKKVGKPVLIDFTGKACVNCRKMEEKVWSENKILNTLNNDVVLISLYVDFKEELPKDEQYVSKETGKEIRTVGNKWSDFQISKYKANAQPYYVLIGHNEENLNDPVGYTPDVEEYHKWLKEGIDNFKK